MTSEIVLATALFALGLFIMVKGGDLFVDAARWISEITGVPKIIIGATIVSLATTLPELMVSVLATLQGSVGITTGNAIGSVTANMGVGLAIPIVTIAGTVDYKSFRVKSLAMLLAALLLLVLTIDGAIGIADGLVLLSCLIVFMLYNLKSGRMHLSQSYTKAKTSEIVINIAYFITGAGAIVIGADLLVDKGIVIARYLGISEMVIGITVIAIGTALPELATAVTATVKKEHGLSIGNIIGANVIDICLILPVCSAISLGKLAIPKAVTYFDIPITLLLMSIAVIPTLIKKRFYPLQGVFLMLSYIGYIVITVVK